MGYIRAGKDTSNSKIYDDKMDVQYAILFEKYLSELEKKLHSVEEPRKIAMTALAVGAEFYDGDWCGIIESDLVMEAWYPILWYDRYSQGMTEKHFKELEDISLLERWIEALYNCKPIIISDTKMIEEINQKEYEIYKRLNAKAILAVPFWKNPTGFLIVRNPKKYVNSSSFLQVLAYVVFSAVTEKKLIERSDKAVSPENIKKETDVFIKLFGQLEIYTSRGIITEVELNSPKISRFLVYLLLQKERAVPSRIFCDMIWPEEAIDNPGGRIKNLAFRLQCAFSVISDFRLVISTPQGYQLNPELNIKTDVELFEEYWLQAQNAFTLQTKIELLKNAANLYKGNVFSSASAEHWLMPYEIAYKYKCLGIHVELMKIYFDSEKYSYVQYYAALSLKIEPTDVDAYYWMIASMKRQNYFTMVKGQLKMAQYILTETEYQELIKRLDELKSLC